VVIGGEVVFTGVPRHGKLEAALAAYIGREPR
jgi:hypothetical protein